MDRKDFDSEINSLLDLAEQTVPQKALPALPPMELCPEVPEWYAFERELWDVGEKIRQTESNGRKHLNAEQLERIGKICLNRNAKRGRQSFVMLLGRKQYSAYAEQLVGLLQDDDVKDHALDSLYKMGASLSRAEIEPFLTSEYTWIRNIAKRYMEKYE